MKPRWVKEITLARPQCRTASSDSGEKSMSYSSCISALEDHGTLRGARILPQAALQHELEHLNRADGHLPKCLNDQFLRFAGKFGPVVPS